MKYVALLRGIGPGDPRMSNSNLRGLFESLGFENVKTFISSGNVLFESDESDVSTLEERIEKALPGKLGFSSQTIIRSEKDLKEIIDADPFPNMIHSHKTNLNITFLKENKSVKLATPQRGEGYEIVKSLRGAICFIEDITGKMPKLMGLLEKEFAKKTTTRSWNTVSRIHALMCSPSSRK